VPRTSKFDHPCRSTCCSDKGMAATTAVSRCIAHARRSGQVMACKNVCSAEFAQLRSLHSTAHYLLCPLRTSPLRWPRTRTPSTAQSRCVGSHVIVYVAHRLQQMSNKQQRLWLVVAYQSRWQKQSTLPQTLHLLKSEDSTLKRTWWSCDSPATQACAGTLMPVCCAPH
jgi:hypothetical protein